MKKLFKNLILILGVVFAIPVYGADFDKGMQAYNKGDYKTAFREWEPLAKQGDAFAQSNLGVMYVNGNGVPQDYKQAVYWYTKSAQQGNAFAQSNLGVMYVNGNGVPQDYKQAVYWYTKSAQQGDAFAQYNLGLMYENGRGVIENITTAYMWYFLAKANGNTIFHKSTQEHMDSLKESSQIHRGQIIIAQERAEWCFNSNYKDCD